MGRLMASLHHPQNRETAGHIGTAVSTVVDRLD